MGKLIIAIDIPEREGLEDRPMVAVWGKGAFKEIPQSKMNEIAVGDVVSFDNAYLLSDREDNSFIEAEFRAWEPDEKKELRPVRKEIEDQEVKDGLKPKRIEL
jgi:hypothetical protein